MSFSPQTKRRLELAAWSALSCALTLAAVVAMAVWFR